MSIADTTKKTITLSGQLLGGVISTLTSSHVVQTGETSPLSGWSTTLLGLAGLGNNITLFAYACQFFDFSRAGNFNILPDVLNIISSGMMAVSGAIDFFSPQKSDFTEIPGSIDLSLNSSVKLKTLTVY